MLVVCPCAVTLIMHATDHDMGSLSDWCAQGDPAVTVDYRVRDGVTPQPSLAPPQPPPRPPSPQLPWAKLWEQVNPRPVLPAGGQ